MRKNIFFIVIIFVVMTSCKKSIRLKFYINNRASTDLQMVRYVNSTDTIYDTIFLKSNSNYIFIELSDLYIGKETRFTFSDVDSIKLFDNNGVERKRYLPDDEGRNIFKTRDTNIWELTEDKKNSFTYTFEIREKDLN